MILTTTIQKWGNSQGIRLPKAILETLSLQDDDRVEIAVENDSIIIKKATRRRRAKKSLEERLEEFYKKPIDEILADDSLCTPQEYDWGKPTGKEYW